MTIHSLADERGARILRALRKTSLSQARREYLELRAQPSNLARLAWLANRGVNPDAARPELERLGHLDAPEPNGRACARPACRRVIAPKQRVAMVKPKGASEPLVFCGALCCERYFDERRNKSNG